MVDKQYDAWFDEIFFEMTKGLEEHTFKHYNHAMGLNINGKAHYKYEMKKRRMIPYKQAHELADKYDRENKKETLDDLSPKASEVLRSLRQGADKHGNIVIGTAGLRALKEIGWIPNQQHKHAPEQPVLSGGFSE